MGVGYLVGSVEKGVLKKLRIWFENYWMEMVRSLQIRQGLLSCEMEYKTEISELVSEFMLDDILILGKSGGGKTKSGIIGIGVWRLFGWEFERWRNPSCRLIVG